MDKKKNIVLISGRDSYGVEQEVKKWITLFRERQSDINIDRISLETLRDGGQIRQHMLSGGLFADKRLFVISGGNEKRDKTTDFVAFFTDVFESLPDDHILLFHSLRERAETLIPLITKVWDVRKHNDLYSKTLWQNRYSELDDRTIAKVVSTYEQIDGILEDWEKNASMSHVIAGTLESLELIAQDRSITDDDIEAVIGTEWGGRSFDLIDAIVALDTQKALRIFEKIASTKSMFEFVPSFIGLLRSALYIKYLEQQGISPTGTKIHPFVVKKTLDSRISFAQIRKLYQHMVTMSIAYKSGKWMKDIELWRIFEIELGIMWLKK
jgi:DNA polymerase III delta subunit